MSSRSLNRKDFLIVTVTAVSASVIAACGDDPVTPTGTAGTGTGGSGTAGTGTAGTGTAGTGTAGTGTAGTTSGGTSAGTGGASGGTGGASGGTGGASGGTGGTGGASGGTGGASGGTGGGGGSGGASGGMCGTASITQTSNEQHDHIPADPATLKADLKAHINGATATMEFTLPMDGNHVHKITLTAQQVTTLKGGGMVTGVTSTQDNTHTHVYTISCAN
jgi:hypothetical protein